MSRIRLTLTMRRKLKLVLLITVFALCVSCATTGQVSPDAVMIDGVPFFSQEAYQCGPTALAIVMDYWYAKTQSGKRVTPEQIAADIYSPSARGVLGIDLELYAGKHGFKTHQYSGSIADLRKNVDLGIPAIIFVDYGFSIYEVNHFMVVTGYTGDSVIVNSGKRENRSIADGELEKIWKKNRYWTLVLKPSA